MDERPDRPVIDLETTRGELDNQAAQGEILARAALDQPISVRTDQFFGPVASHLPGGDTSGPAEAIHPPNCSADGHSIPLSSLVAGKPVDFNRRYNAVAKIHRIRPGHACWPPSSKHVES
jgi:hypothetical protein